MHKSVQDVLNQLIVDLDNGFNLTVTAMGRNVYLVSYKHIEGKTIRHSHCDFTDDWAFCTAILDKLVEMGKITKEQAEYVKGRAEALVAKVQAKGSKAEGEGEGAAGVPIDVIAKLISVPRNDQGALRELRDLISHIVIATSQLARRYHALGYLTERIILSKVGLSNEEALELWKATDEEYLARMLKYIADMADVYENFNAKVMELKNQLEELKEENNRLTVEVAYLEETLDRVKRLAEEASQLLDALKVAIAAQAPVEVINELIQAYLNVAAEIKAALPKAQKI